MLLAPGYCVTDVSRVIGDDDGSGSDAAVMVTSTVRRVQGVIRRHGVCVHGFVVGDAAYPDLCVDMHVLRLEASTVNRLAREAGCALQAHVALWTTRLVVDDPDVISEVAGYIRDWLTECVRALRVGAVLNRRDIAHVEGNIPRDRLTALLLHKGAAALVKDPLATQLSCAEVCISASCAIIREALTGDRGRWRKGHVTVTRLAEIGSSLNLSLVEDVIEEMEEECNGLRSASVEHDQEVRHPAPRRDDA